MYTVQNSLFCTLPCQCFVSMTRIRCSIIHWQGILLTSGFLLPIYTSNYISPNVFAVTFHSIRNGRKGTESRRDRKRWQQSRKINKKIQTPYVCVSSTNRLTWLNTYSRTHWIDMPIGLYDSSMFAFHMGGLQWLQHHHHDADADAKDNISLMRYEAVSTDTILHVLMSFSTFYFSFVFFRSRSSIQ